MGAAKNILYKQEWGRRQKICVLLAVQITQSKSNALEQLDSYSNPPIPTK